MLGYREPVIESIKLNIYRTPSDTSISSHGLLISDWKYLADRPTYCEIPWERMPYLSALEVYSRRGAIEIHVYLPLHYNCWSPTNFGRVCLTVCHTINPESVDTGSSYLHIRYISKEYGSSSNMKVTGSQSQDHRSKKGENSYSRNVKIRVAVTPVL